MGTPDEETTEKNKLVISDIVSVTQEVELNPVWHYPMQSAFPPNTCLPFTIPLQAGNILIESLQVRTSDPEILYRVMVFAGEAADDPMEWRRRSMIPVEESKREVFTFAGAAPLPYRSAETSCLYGGLSIGQRPVRFDLDYDDNLDALKRYHTARVKYEITLRYRCE